jgi:hypothetical protein
MKKYLIMLICSLGVLSLGGCATIMSGTSQTVNVQVINAKNHKLISGAKCTLKDADGIYYPINSNPGSVNLPRVYGGLNVNCTAKGYYQKQVGAGSSFNAWVVADILFWPGAIVDAATGAAQKYPSHITVLMSTHPVKKPGSSIIKAH